MRYKHCYYCRRQFVDGPNKQTSRTRDHVIPRQAGGKRTVAACLQCNQLKGNMRPAEWQDFMLENPQWWIHFHNRADALRWEQARRWRHKDQAA